MKNQKPNIIILLPNTKQINWIHRLQTKKLNTMPATSNIQQNGKLVPLTTSEITSLLDSNMSFEELYEKFFELKKNFLVSAGPQEAISFEGIREDIHVTLTAKKATFQRLWNTYKNTPYPAEKNSALQSFIRHYEQTVSTIKIQNHLL